MMTYRFFVSYYRKGQSNPTSDVFFQQFDRHDYVMLLNSKSAQENLARMHFPWIERIQSIVITEMPA